MGFKSKHGWRGSVCLSGLQETVTRVPSGVRVNEQLQRSLQTGDPSPVATEPTECQGKRGVSFDFKDADDLDALALGMSWW